MAPTVVNVVAHIVQLPICSPNGVYLVLSLGCPGLLGRNETLLGAGGYLSSGTCYHTTALTEMEAECASEASGVKTYRSS